MAVLIRDGRQPSGIFSLRYVFWRTAAPFLFFPSFGAQEQDDRVWTYCQGGIGSTFAAGGCVIFLPAAMNAVNEHISRACLGNIKACCI